MKKPNGYSVLIDGHLWMTVCYLKMAYAIADNLRSQAWTNGKLIRVVKTD